MSIRPVPRVVGAPAVGNSFFDRENLIRKIFHRLSSGSILLVAPRRFGKTSIMLQAKGRLVAEGALAIYLDVEWVSEPSDFITEVLYKLRENTGGRFSNWVQNLPKNLLTSIKKSVESVDIRGFRLTLRKELKDNWMENGHDIFKALKAMDQDFVLFVDEFPLMLHNILVRRKLKPAEIRSFLYWLRSIRIETNVKMVFGGSIGIGYILQNLEAVASINDLERIVVGPFDKKTAEDFIISLFRSENIEIRNDSVSKILEMLREPIPYFTQIMVSALVSEVRSSGDKISPKMVENVYVKRVLGAECKSYFEHYFQRLSIYYSPEEANIVKKMLKELALKREMSKTELYRAYSMHAERRNVEQFNHLVDDLENDFYIRLDETKNEYRFATRVLQDLWLRRYEVLE